MALRHVGKTYANGVAALSDLSLTVVDNEFLSLLGPSGCGKSTALRILAGLIAPTAGNVVWTDDSSADHRGQIGFVFQDPTLMPWATVADNVWLPLRLRGVGRREARDRIGESLNLVGIGDFADAFPHELSGGMKMRASLARALVVRPRLLLMDEPFAALDELTRFRLNDDLLAVREKLGCTVVFVTHSVFESVYLSDRIAVMTARPGAIAAEVPIDPHGPRDVNFRTSAPYAQLCRDVSDRLASRNRAGEA